MIAAIIQARMGATRLPGKVLMDLNRKPVLWHVIQRVSKVQSIDTIIVATTTNRADDAIVQFCITNNITVCRGSENDVLDRFYRCASHYSADVIVRITADCPLHDPEIISLVLETYLEGGYDYVTNTFDYTFPDGMDVEVFSFSALKDAWERAKLDSEREHVTPFIRSNPALKKKNVTAKKIYPHVRLTLDSPEDFKLMVNVYENLGDNHFSLDEVIDYLEKNPAIKDLNSHLVCNEGYFRSLVKDAKKNSLTGDRIYLKALKISDATEDYCNWLANPRINEFLETKMSTREELAEYIKGKEKDDHSLFLGIFLKDTNRHIGNIKLDPIEYDKKRATIGILVGDPSMQGKGICSEAIKILVDYSFQNLLIREITLGVIKENEAAIRCYKSAGFSINSIEEYTGINKDRYHEKYIMSIRCPNLNLFRDDAT